MRLALVLGLAACGRIHFTPLDQRGDADVPSNGDAAGTDGPGGTDGASGARCTEIDASTVALYRFAAADPALDATGNHSGTVRGTLQAVAGPCGDAARFSSDAYILVPDSPAFDLATGSIELYARTSQVVDTTIRGFFGRDASGTALPGHIQVGLAEGGTIVARIQSSDMTFNRCAPAPAPDTWFHVGISFGGVAGQGFRLWVDGVEGTLSSTTYGGSVANCTVAHGGGIAGNDNALVLGANNGRGAEGAADPAVQHYLNGDLDHLVIHGVWIDFGDAR
jgi:hypothetical protein